jgi:glycosyltransferase involved in cell wall biosynthesis
MKKLLQYKYSVVIPVFNEEDSLAHLCEEIESVMRGMGESFEMIAVNDASLDQSLKKLRELQTRFPQMLKIVDLPRRCGQTWALKKGFEAAQGDILVTMDADLQNDPADIPRLAAYLQNGFDVVCGWRKVRQDKPLKTVLSKCGNFLQRLLTGLSIHDVSCTLRVYRRSCLKNLRMDCEGRHRFIPLCLSLQGYRVGEVVVHHRERRFGVSKYRHRRIVKVMRDFFYIWLSRGGNA